MVLSCVSPEGRFIYGIHKPRYRVKNLRKNDFFLVLGHFPDGSVHDNRDNFSAGDVEVASGKRIYEIANAFFFRGATFIDSARADRCRENPESIGLPPPPDCSLRETLAGEVGAERLPDIFSRLPRPVLYGLAATSTDPEELMLLAENCCRLERDRDSRPTGLAYRRTATGEARAVIDDFELFETIANNPFLPDDYKEVMVLRPGVQGSSEIVGEVRNRESHVFEYLRANSYIPWGHYASNTAHDQIRYTTTRLTVSDMKALRHLYYQRIYVILARQLGLKSPGKRQGLSEDELEELRMRILARSGNETLPRSATLWGWNFGYDISASGYRLHASHQQIHQQYAMVPETVESYYGHGDPAGNRPAYGCGDLVSDHIARYKAATGSDFFEDYRRALLDNRRMDLSGGEADLIVFADDHVMLFVPKAQVSQWEMQLMVTADGATGPVGNIVEADIRTRRSLDKALLLAQHIYARLGARMVTTIEYAKRLGLDNGQRLLYSFLPKLPWAMGAFSEAQLRFICGHYPEDFASRCRGCRREQEEADS